MLTMSRGPMTSGSNLTRALLVASATEAWVTPAARESLASMLRTQDAQVMPEICSRGTATLAGGGAGVPPGALVVIPRPRPGGP